MGSSALHYVVIWMALLFTLASAIPSLRSSTPLAGTASNSKRSFSSSLRHTGKPIHGPYELYKTMRKYGAKPPLGLEKHVRLAADAHDGGKGKTSATSAVNNSMWITEVKIGSPGQKLMIDFDTGSADTWVVSDDTYTEYILDLPLYHPNKSTTSHKVANCSWEVRYGDGSYSTGIVYRDALQLGDVIVPNMTIESAVYISDSFSEGGDSSGLGGLAFPSIAQTVPKQPTLLELLPHVLDEPIFTTDLRHNSSDGTINFGFIDHDLHSEEIKFVNVNSTKGFWGVQLTGYAAEARLNGTGTRYVYQKPPTLIADTGTTLLYVPKDTVKNYYKTVPGAIYSEDYPSYGWTIPCKPNPPDFFWEIGDGNSNGTSSARRISGVIPGKYIAYEDLTDQGMPNMCYSGIQYLGDDMPIDGVLGDIFLKSSFQVWNFVNRTFGIAPKKSLLVKRDTPDPFDVPFRGKTIIIP